MKGTKVGDVKHVTGEKTDNGEVSIWGTTVLNDNLSKISKVLQEGNIKEFIQIVESEALSLHAMMMTSNPYFILMKPNTLEIINKIWEYRIENDSNICFTLDAGANVHVLYPEREKTTINAFIENKLSQYCQKNQYICDAVGFGAKKL